MEPTQRFTKTHEGKGTPAWDGPNWLCKAQYQWAAARWGGDSAQDTAWACAGTGPGPAWGYGPGTRPGRRQGPRERPQTWEGTGTGPRPAWGQGPGSACTASAPAGRSACPAYTPTPRATGATSFPSTFFLCSEPGLQCAEPGPGVSTAVHPGTRAPRGWRGRRGGVGGGAREAGWGWGGPTGHQNTAKGMATASCVGARFTAGTVPGLHFC